MLLFRPLLQSLSWPTRQSIIRANILAFWKKNYLDKRVKMINQIENGLSSENKERRQGMSWWSDRETNERQWEDRIYRWACRKRRWEEVEGGRKDRGNQLGVPLLSFFPSFISILMKSATGSLCLSSMREFYLFSIRLLFARLFKSLPKAANEPFHFWLFFHSNTISIDCIGRILFFC